VGIGDQLLNGKIEGTGGWDNYKTVSLGTLTVDKAGVVTLSVKCTKMPGFAVLNLRTVLLKPAS